MCLVAGVGFVAAVLDDCTQRGFGGWGSTLCTGGQSPEDLYHLKDSSLSLRM